MKNAINISQFFSKQNEEEGKWYEPKVRGVGVGFEVKVYGPNSSAASMAQDKYQKARDEINKISDEKAKIEATDKMLAEYAAALICDIRPIGNKKLTMTENGPEVTIKDIKEIMYQAPILASDIARFESNQNNFLSN